MSVSRCKTLKPVIGVLQCSAESGSARLLRRRTENYSLIFAAACAANIILLKSGCGHHGVHVGLNFAGEFNVKFFDQHLGHGR